MKSPRLEIGEEPIPEPLPDTQPSGIDLEQLEQENAIWPWLGDDSMADCYAE